MSLVGPRPERPVFVEKFAKTIPNYMARHAVKAGITGWAQVNGWRGNSSLRKRVQFDLYYITPLEPALRPPHHVPDRLADALPEAEARVLVRALLPAFPLGYDLMQGPATE